MSLRVATLAVGVILIGTARADACPPSVALEGDPALVSSVGDQLIARGISIDSPSCPGFRARVEHRGAQVVIDLDGPDGVPIERVVSESGTAATVIESFVRADVSTPLLAIRAIPAAAPDHPVRSPLTARVPSRERSGTHVFGTFESAYANDRTGWLGIQVGVCIMWGPVCAAARFRVSAVASGDGPWEDTASRRSSELLVGFDVPFSVGSWLLMPGAAAGIGNLRTQEEPGEAMTREIRSIHRETGGLRAELHATLSIPLTTKLAIELSAAAVLAQEETVQEAFMVELPPEPWALARFGVGLRYGKR